MTTLGTSESGTAGTEGESCLLTLEDMHLTRTYGCNGSLSDTCFRCPPPRIILAQVTRFQPDGAGRIQSPTGCVTNWTAEVSVPIYEGAKTRQIVYHPYNPAAVLMHAGHAPTSGHYTCGILRANHVYICDDNVRSQCLDALTPAHMKLVYGILYIPVM